MFPVYFPIWHRSCCQALVSMIREGERAFDGEIEVGDLLSGLVVVSVGRGGPVQASLNRAVRAAGGIVVVKASGASVLGMLDAFVPSVVLTEVVPGDEEGPALLAEIQRRPPERGG